MLKYGILNIEWNHKSLRWMQIHNKYVIHHTSRGIIDWIHIIFLFVSPWASSILPILLVIGTNVSGRLFPNIDLVVSKASL